MGFKLKKSFLFALTALLVFGVPIVYGFTFNSEPYEDTSGDGYDFGACFYGDEMVPMPVAIDIVSVTTAVPSVKFWSLRTGRYAR